MSNSEKDKGVIAALMKRGLHETLPRLLEVQQKVNGGERLDETDLSFLEHALTNARDVLPIVDRNPEYQEIVAKIMTIYEEVTEKDLQLENEQK